MSETVFKDAPLVVNYRTEEATFLKGSDLMTVEDMDPGALPADAAGASHNHGEVRGVFSA